MQRLIALISLLCIALPAVANSPRYRVTDIGPDFTTYLENVSINNKGQIVGVVKTGTPGVQSNIPCRAFLWQHGRRTAIAPVSYFSATLASAINDSGQVAGTLHATWNGAELFYSDHAFLWERGKLRDIGAKSKWQITQAEAINSKGQIVGRAIGSARQSDDEQLNQPHAFLFSDGEMHDLGEGEATGINDNGQVVGASFFGPKHEATLWHNGWAWDLGIRGRAVAVNNKGQILIMTDGGNPSLYLLESGASHALPPFAARSHCIGIAINNRGQIVGCSQTEYGEQRALLWQGGRVYGLNRLLPLHSGWTLEAATSINDKGQIAGEATFHGNPHAFLLTPR